MNKIRFFLITFPCIVILNFFISSSIAIAIYPGSEKDVIDYKSDHYSFTHNFFSELGSLKTNGNRTNYAIKKMNNTSSMLLFNSALILIGISISLFYVFFYRIFQLFEDSKKAKFYSSKTKFIGIIVGIFFAGIGLIPVDLHFKAHILVAQGAFCSLFILSMIHFLALRNSILFKSLYSYGYFIFSILLISYLCIVFFGPKIHPGIIFSESDLMLQVVAQKVIVLSFILTILFQAIGIRKIINQHK